MPEDNEKKDGMAVVKWRDKEGHWVQLYGDAILNRSRRDKNLADLSDKQAARDNLGLAGDVTTHEHKRYDDAIEKEKQERLANEKTINDSLDMEIQNREKATNDTNKSLSDLEKRLNKNINEINNNISMSEQNTNKKMDAVSQQVASSDVAQKTITVPNSTMPRNIITTSVIRRDTRREQFNDTYRDNVAEPANTGGPHTIADILTELCKLAHTHQIEDGRQSGWYNCDCDCNCDCGDDGE